MQGQNSPHFGDINEQSCEGTNLGTANHDRTTTQSIARGLLLHLPVLAQPQPDDYIATPTDHRSAEGALEEVTVTARKVGENLQDVPVAVTALTPETLEKFSVREMEDLNALAPSLNVRGSGSGTQALTFSLRGQGQSGILLTQDIPVGIYVDGINNPRPLGLRGPMVDVQQVEVLRGPQGTLFGRNTTGGAITITSRKPGEDWGAMFRARIGDYGENDFLGVFNAPLNDSVATRFVVNKRNHDAYGYDISGNELDDEDSIYLRAKLLGTWGNFEVDITAHYESTERGGPRIVVSGLVPATDTLPPGGFVGNLQIARELGLPETPEGLAEASQLWQSNVFTGGSGKHLFPNTPQYSDNESYGLSVIATWTKSDTWQFRSLTGYRHLDRNNRLDLDGSQFTIYDILFPVTDEYLSQELQGIANFDRFNLVAGVFGDYEDGNDGQSAITIPLVAADYAIVDGDVTSQSLAAYAQADWHITDSLTATAGVRYTREKKELLSRNRRSSGTCTVPVSLRETSERCAAKLSDTYKDPSWLASLDYKLANGDLVYGKISRGTKAGGQNLRAQFSEAAFQDFEPEEVTEYEVGWKSMLFDQRMRLNLAAFYSDYENIQRQIVTGGGSTTLVTNAAKGTVSGLELESSMSLPGGITANAALSYIDAKYDEFIDFSGDRTDEDWPAPDWQYSIGAEYVKDLAFGPMIVQVAYVGQSELNLYPSGKFREQLTQESYGLLNAQLRFLLEDQGMEFSVYGRNLTDESYFIGGTSIEALGYNHLNLGAPRTWGVEFTARFGGEL